MRLRTSIIVAIAGILTAMLAQESCAQDATGQAQAAPLSAAQLDQLLAPIALYPDPLLTQILMASTYPLEVVEANRWVQDPHNAALTGSDLEAALRSEPWDPSVKSLVPFPQILRMMDNNLSWTEQLGDAFLADRQGVMDSVQRLRKQAEAAGNLRSSPYGTVQTQGSVIVIEPAAPDIVYVPVYDPFVVYGAWPYPAYPPFYFPGYFDFVVAGGAGFGWFGFTIVQPLWGWSRWDWGQRFVFINHTRFNEINVGGPRIDRDIWHHDPGHRHGVPYRDVRTRERFEGPGETRETRRFRGYPTPVPQPAGQPQPMAPVQPQPRFEERRQPREEPRHPPREEFRQPRTRESAPPAFESFGRGGDVRTQSERGVSSRHAPPAMQTPGAAPRAGGGHSRGGTHPQGGGNRATPRRQSDR